MTFQFSDSKVSSIYNHIIKDLDSKNFDLICFEEVTSKGKTDVIEAIPTPTSTSVLTIGINPENISIKIHTPKRFEEFKYSLSKLLDAVTVYNILVEVLIN